MRFGSICSGIEAASVAWNPLGWEAAWFSEIAPFPSALLAHRYPGIPNVGDMTNLPEKILSGKIEAPDVICGGTPCFPEGTLILTKNGEIPIESIKEGMYVYTHLDRYQKVTKTMSRRSSTFIVEGLGGKKIETTEEHPFLSKISKQTASRWMKASDMKNRYWASPTIINNHEDMKSEFTLENKLWEKVRTVYQTNKVKTVYNFEVEEDNSYIADGIVVHNCQAFSIAGKRESLNDDRGNLSLKFVEVCDATDTIRIREGRQPAIILWENVPGVLSTKDNAFGCFLAGLAGENVPLVPPGGKWTDSGCVLGPKRAVAWRCLNAQYFGLAQRRQRVFVVASAGEVSPSKILFEFESLRRDSPPSRETGQRVTRTTKNSIDPYDRGIASTLRSGGDGGVPSSRGENIVVSPSLTASNNPSRSPQSSEITQQVEAILAAETAPCLRTNSYNNSDPNMESEMLVMQKKYNEDTPVGFYSTGGTHGVSPQLDVSPAIKVGSGANIPSPPAVLVKETYAVQLNGDRDNPGVSVSEEVAFTIPSNPMSDRGQAIVSPTITKSWYKGPGLGSQDGMIVLDDKQKNDKNNSNPGIIETNAEGSDGFTITKSNTANHLNNQTPLVVIDRASFNQGENAQFDMNIKESDTVDTLVSRGPHAVLYENHPADSRITEAKENISPAIVGRAGTGGGNLPLVCERLETKPIAFAQNSRDEVREIKNEVTGAITSQRFTKQQTFVAVEDTNEPIGFLPGNSSDSRSLGESKGIAPTIRSGSETAVTIQDVRNLNKNQNGSGISEKDVAYTIDKTGSQGIVEPTVVNARQTPITSNVAQPLDTYSSQAIQTEKTNMAVRRLTPTECEILMGFPKGYTAIPWKGKAPEDCPDAHRYAALGNSWAVPVVQWIGRRIMLFSTNPKPL